MKRLIILLLCCSGMVSAQPVQLIDSLLRVTREAPHDTSRAEAFIHLVYHHRSDREKATAFARQGISLARKSNFTRGLFNLHNQLGVVYDLKSEYQNALNAYTEALKHAQTLGREDMLAMVHTNMGLTYSNLGSYDKALEQYFDALEQYSDTAKYKVYRASTYNNIGIVYSQIKERQKARDYFNKAISTLEGIDDPYNYAAFITNLANEDREAGAFEKAIKLFEEAYQKHLLTNNRYGQAMVKYNIGISYQGMLQYDLAERYLFESAAIRKEIGDRFGLAMCYNMLASGFRDKKQLATALVYSDSALGITKELESVDLYFKIYRQRWYTLREAGKLAEALEAHVLFKMYSDSMNAEASDKRFKELEVRYDVAQKDQKLALNELALREQQVSLQRRNFLLIALTLVLVLLVSLGLVLRSRYRYKQKELLAHAALKMQQQQLEAVISAQEAEKFRFAQDLHDGMGQLLTALRLSLVKSNAAEPSKSEVLVEELYSELRNLAYNIMPQTLLRKGLVEALRELTERLQGSLQNQSIAFSSFGLEKRLPIKTEQLLYRVLQELLSNVLKYANASHIELNVVADSKHVSIMLEDNGVGFDPLILDQSKGHGWANVQSRLQMLGASILVDSRPGRPGTTFSIDLPLSPKA
ncbi:MAG: tetratricopeptide repeat protein [Sphingobacteriaceae bacterium]|nr:tetratricopeptide repeat protein [Sphingobacteriaceae bacterium]